MRARQSRTTRALAALVVAAVVGVLLQLVAAASPAAAADWVVTLRLTKTSDLRLNLQATSSRSIPGSGYTLAIWDATTGTRLKACDSAPTPCDGTSATGYFSTSVTTIPSAPTSDLSGVGHSYVATVSADDDSYPPAQTQATSDAVQADPWKAAITSTVLNNKTVQLTATTNYSLPSSGYSLAVFDRTTGQLLKACNNGVTPCEGSSAIGWYYTRTATVPRATTGDLSSVAHQYVAVVAGGVDALPGDNLAATSAPVGVDPWRISLSSATTSDKRVTLTAALNYNVAGTGYSLAIFDRTTGRLVTACGSSDNPCSGTSGIGYYYTRATILPRGSTTDESSVAHQYVAVLAQDVSSLPGQNVAVTSTPVTVSPWLVNLTGVVNITGTYTLTAATNYTVAGSGYTLAIYDRTTGTRVAVCGTGQPLCSGTSASGTYWLRVSGRAEGWDDEYVSVISDDSAGLPADNQAAVSAPLVPSTLE